MPDRVSGKVKFYSAEKGWGFVTKLDGTDVFVHKSKLADGIPYLVANQTVTFEEFAGRDGKPAALEVKLG